MYTDVSEDNTVSTLVLDRLTEHKGTRIFRNVCNYLPIRILTLKYFLSTFRRKTPLQATNADITPADIAPPLFSVHFMEVSDSKFPSKADN